MCKRDYITGSVMAGEIHTEQLVPGVPEIVSVTNCWGL